MKTIGLVGGTGWISTAEYYRIINEEVNRRRGGFEFGRCILYSLNYGDIDRCHKSQDIEGIHSLLLDASKKLVGVGAECILLCANTMHMFADRLEREIPVPLIHIGVATAKAVNGCGLSTIGLLGTKLTMEKDFYKMKLKSEGVEAIVPETDDREFIQQTIDHELLMSIINNESRKRFLGIIEKLRAKGAEGIVLGCTEIPLLIQQEHTDLPVFSTTAIHALAAVDFSLDKP
ncbi:MAG: amino acid racemase [Ignavibacteria bacterium]|nr:amino acid racemase [Ignavibacteria bacterium]